MRFDPKLPDTSVNTSPQHPLRDAGLLVAGVCALSVVAVFVIALAVDLLVPHLPASVEARTFAFLGYDATAEPGLEPDPRTRQLQAFVDRLALHWDDNPYEFRVEVLDEDEFNAFAVPGGKIVITRGLLEAMESETELSLVLGHEIGHFKQRDHLRGLGRGLGLAAVLTVLDFGGAGGALDLMSGASGIAGRHFDRDQESGADAVGLDLVWREYGHVAGATRFFERFPPPSSQVEAQLQTYLATHPVDEERIRSLDAMADERGWRRDGEVPKLVLDSRPPAR